MRIAKHYCDKCKREVLCEDNPTGLINMSLEFTKDSYGMGLRSRRKEVCHDCFAELTGVPIRDNGYLNEDEMPREEANETVGERLEEIIREVCKWEGAGE